MAEELTSSNLYEESDLVPFVEFLGFGKTSEAWRTVNRDNVRMRLKNTFGRDFTTQEQEKFFQEDDLFTTLTSVRASEIAHIKDEKNKSLILQKIYQSGLLELVEQAGGIREFARLRFQNAEKLRASAAEFNDPIRDTLWLTQLVKVKNFFYKDPLTLATVYKYFPNMYRLFITALAATGDYGYSDEDPLNNHQQIMENMFKAFGTNENGEAVFKPVWAIDNFTTAQKIEKIIKETAAAASTPPATPDIFHLRLGAANFYVPPITISVNTGFKTGSYTNGAIRQKASPKYNTGYKETTINLKLYFPNYEEIWGTSITDATKVSLNSNYFIDFNDIADEQKVDKFLSSLRGLVAAFKYSPILPIKNHYLNSVFNITGVALTNMTISTVPNYPFTLEVDLELSQFNHKPFLPMIKDFNQAIHWGKYRYYMGRAAGALANSVNVEFLLNTVTEEVAPITAEGVTTSDGDIYDISPYGAQRVIQPYKDGLLTTNVMNDWVNGKNITLYIPSEVQSKIYNPDLSGFRSEEKKSYFEHGRAFWENLLNKIGIDLTDASVYKNLDYVLNNSLNTVGTLTQKQKAAKITDVILAGINGKNVYESVYDALVVDYINTEKITDPAVIDYLKNRQSPSSLQVPVQTTQELTDALRNKKWELYMAAQSNMSLLDQQIASNTEAVLKSKKIAIDKNSKEWTDTYALEKEKFMNAFYGSLYERTFKDEGIQELLGIALVRDAEKYSQIDGRKISAFTIKEWEVPMMKIDLDPTAVIVNAVSLSMGNNMAKFQLQMQDEPTYQYIGSKDSIVSVSMTIFGEKELQKIRKMFEFLSGLARLEQAAGVIGFMGIKNIVCALAGIKYVLPLNYSVNTVEGYPHVYAVNLTLVDFDIFQQKRENISSEQQLALVKEFGTKKNPFLRLKQNWGAFNAYPDMPLAIVNESTNEHVGSLDPDFYFRSFEMYDNDVVNNIIDPENYTLPVGEWENEKTHLNDKGKSFVYFIKKKLIENNGNIEDIKTYLIDDNKLSADEAMKLFRIAIFDQQNEPEFENSLQSSGYIANKYPTIWKDMIDSFKSDDVEYNFEDIKFDTRYGNIKIGDLISGSKEQVEKFNKLIADTIDESGQNKIPSFDPDDVDHFGLMHLIPAADAKATEKIPAIYQTPDGGYIMGYSNTSDGRFYVAQDFLRVSSNGKLVPTSQVTKISDTQTPERDKQNAHTGIPGAASLDSYMNAYGSGKKDKLEAVSSGGTHKGVAKHWQKMMMDTQYRDISGRMLRAYPTYMLWLVDDSNYFAGVKLFDNFYGLQSVVDFSIVQSEDILGDTLMLRVSNTYSKLSKPEPTLSSIVNTDNVVGGGMVDDGSGNLTSNLTPGTVKLAEVLLTRSFNARSHMRARYITEIAQMRLKPGVRVHLRAGYGSNPNSLQTVFNGVIAEVEHGEIITIIAQSDAIELSPIINSTKKKGDSGKIDGGLNTGLWMSEPRDLMVRLLSMGASRTREAFAHATRGAVFSENKFGIRHFGSILYEPLTPEEAAKASMYRQSVTNAFNSIAKNPVTGTIGLATNSAANIVTGGTVTGLSNALNATSAGLISAGTYGGMESFGGSVRTPIVGAMQTMWANFSTQRDLEIFKRNIYPGNGAGVAQFLGGDLDDGWSTMASIDISQIEEDKFGYAQRLSDRSWSGLLEQSQSSANIDANAVLERATAGSELLNSRTGLGTSAILGGGLALAAGVGTVAATATGVGAVGGVALGAGLLKSLHGRGFSNIMKTLGLVSDLDDDIYDEVSFRAQTYMRSVWDMFQLCAKLLPNYIVAVRPFEDRSTVFYGKPHWLYTSGVYPISTGFPSEEKAQQDGVSIPGYIQPDDSLQKILDIVNKNTAPISDYNALAQAQESTLSDGMANITKQMLSFSGVFKAGSALRGKVINFADKNRTYYKKNNEIVSKLPVTVGKVQVGFHLPFSADGKGVTSPMQKEEHLQIDQLPIRFRYPFFTNRTSGTLPSLDFDKILKGNEDSDIGRTLANVVQLSLLEKNLIEKKDSDTTALVSKKGDETSLDFTFNFASKVRYLGLEDTLIGTAAFDPSGIFDPDANLGELRSAQLYSIQMPLPIILDYSDIQIESKEVKFTQTFQKYYDDLDPIYNLQQEFDSLPLNFAEWGMPKTAEEEQFHIAMRWPYNPITARAAQGLDKGANEQVQREVLKKFLQMHNFSEDELVGSPEEYKKRRVLVYNPNTKTAVVCAPAYFLWGKTEADGDGSNDIDAIVSPDAAYFLGILTDEKGRIVSPTENIKEVSVENANGEGIYSPDAQWNALGMVEQNLSSCLFTFVSDSTPLGVVTSSYNPANEFGISGKFLATADTMLIGFGAFIAANREPLDDILDANNDLLPARSVMIDGNFGHPSLKRNTHTGLILEEEIIPETEIQLKTIADWQKEWSQGGNYIQYYNNIISNNLEELSRDKLFEKIEEDRDAKTYSNFAAVYDPLDNVSVIARGFYDEKFDNTVKVIAGNGRKVTEAQQIWDQFRFGYHTYSSTKNVFQQIYGLDPDDDTISSDPIFEILVGKRDLVLEEFGADTRSAEFTTLLGADWLSSVSAQTAAKQSAIDIATDEYVDGGYDGRDDQNNPIINKDKGIIDAYNALIYNKVRSIKSLVANHFETYEYANEINQNSDNTGNQISSSDVGTSNIYDTIRENLNKSGKSQTPQEKAEVLLESIKSAKQLYLLLVGIFRQKLWSDPYARAWLVLRPSRKRFSATGVGAVAQRAIIPAAMFDVFGNENDEWSFRSVDSIFHAFIDYNAEYSTSQSSFLKLLQRNAKEGSSAGNWVTGVLEDVDSFWDRNIGPIFSAFDAALGNLLNMFRLSMAQMGYQLNELENFTKQANILNKAYNDSIYYSLGRPGTLLRAVDNPFTREYGEPVVEIREPFQRLHYISSFNHILANNIKENGQVATQITAVSDGKYPVTVSLDKAAPPEKQIEKTVETGLYFDNAKGEGVFGILHPIFHPLETTRGIAKHAQGDPDELTARRVALADLKESIKDIYGGEIILVGNTDIRPHDLVYLADVYERMYGIFEVEQVVHHFTPETGFITSITPNAFVTVNDPARWFMSSWIASHFSMQNLRNDTRLLLANKSNNSRLTVNGDVSIDAIGDMLKDQMLGGVQYTHGHSALLKDIQANQLADSLPETSDKIKELIKAQTGRTSNGMGAAVFAGLVMPALTATATVGATIAGGPLAGAAVAAGMSLATDAAWGAWKWVRDNVLDQHGCYVQYLSKNGQPMDAGLSNFQGMVVGKYHSKKLLPNILGVRSKVKTAEGNVYIRNDDLLMSMGWREKEIATLVRQISLENAIVQSEILKYSGLGPEKTGLNQFFKAIVTVTHVKDGDTINVYDILTNKEYTVRFDGINTAELDKNNITSDIAIINPNSPASKALHYTKEALEGKVFVLRISPKISKIVLTSDDYEAGSTYNNPEYYSTAIKGQSYLQSDDRYMASVFYRTEEDVYNSIISRIRGIFLAIPESTSNSINYVKDKVKELINPQSVIYSRFDVLYETIFEQQASYINTPPPYSTTPDDGYIHFETIGSSDPLLGLTNAEKRSYDVLVALMILFRVYEKASEWPMAEWNEYYNDGSPITLNWELVTTGLAKVYTAGLTLREGPALQTVGELIAMPREVE